MYSLGITTSGPATRAAKNPSSSSILIALPVLQPRRNCPSRSNSASVRGSFWAKIAIHFPHAPGSRTVRLLLYKCRLRGGERLSVLSDDTNFFSVDAREFHGFSKKCVFFVLVVRRERILVDYDHVGAVTTGAGEVRQQTFNLRNY